MDRFLFETRLALRALLRAKLVTLSAVVAMALGIGATTTLFSIVRGATRSLPFRDAEQLMVVRATSPRQGSLPTRPFDYQQWSEQQRSFEMLSAFRTAAVSLGEARGAERVGSVRHE
jgi:hypothetical protein